MSKSTYDKHYKTENYFGEPYKGLVDFFRKYEPKGNILDLGCDPDKYNCIYVDDNLIQIIINDLKLMKTYYNELSRREFGSHAI